MVSVGEGGVEEWRSCRREGGKKGERVMETESVRGASTRGVVTDYRVCIPAGSI